MALGEFAHIALSVTSLDNSSAFYEQLGFVTVAGNVHPWRWGLLTDGKIRITINEMAFPSPSLTYFAEDMPERLQALRSKGMEIGELKEQAESGVLGYLVDPNGLGISLIHSTAPRIEGPISDITSKLGTFGELSIPTQSLEASIDFWTRADFQLSGRYEHPYPWAICNDGIMPVGLYQSNEFRRPALTYFSRDSARRIEQLKAEGVRIAEEKDTSHAVLESPDGQPLFVYQGDMD